MPAKCGAPPVPEMAKFSLPGLARAWATDSRATSLIALPSIDSTRSPSRNPASARAALTVTSCSPSGNGSAPHVRRRRAISSGSPAATQEAGRQADSAGHVAGRSCPPRCCRESPAMPHTARRSAPFRLLAPGLLAAVLAAAPGAPARAADAHGGRQRGHARQCDLERGGAGVATAGGCKRGRRSGLGHGMGAVARWDGGRGVAASDAGSYDLSKRLNF